VPIERSQLPALGRICEEPAFGTRRIYSPATRTFVEYRVIQRADLAAGHVIDGPAAIEEAGTTTLVESGDVLSVEAHGCLVIKVGG